MQISSCCNCNHSTYNGMAWRCCKCGEKTVKKLLEGKRGGDIKRKTKIKVDG